MRFLPQGFQGRASKYVAVRESLIKMSAWSRRASVPVMHLSVLLFLIMHNEDTRLFLSQVKRKAIYLGKNKIQKIIREMF